jgi:hypothetical protein
MKLLKEIPETAMVAAYLKAELTSVRFSGELKAAMKKLGVAKKVIAEPELKNETENELRARVLGEYRGYSQNREMFEDVPANLTWYAAELTRSEIGDLHYVDYSYWNELTDRTHRVKDGTANIRKGKIVFSVSNGRFLAVAEGIRQGRYKFEPIILWGDSKDATLTILEGHLRATALSLAAEKAPETIKVIIGLKQPADL